MTPNDRPAWDRLPPPLQAAAWHWAQRWQARNTGQPGGAGADVPPPPSCGACQQLLEALCVVGPPQEGWCDLRTQVILGQVDPATTMQQIFDTADPAVLLRARDWVRDHG